MSQRPMTASELRALLEQALSSGVRPYLRSQGFTKHGRTFRRTRGPRYDTVNFQGSKHNHHHDVELQQRAEEAAERINARIELIGGRRLAGLMVKSEVGVQPEVSATLYRLDEDFFDGL